MRAPQLVYTATACAALRAAAVRRLRPTRRLVTMRGLDAFAAAADASWTRSLNADPESKQHEPNKSSRRVRSGHYVPVAPTALQSPELKLHSRELCEELGLSEADVKDERFARFFISTITGLIFGLLSPLAAFGRSPLLALVGTSLVLGTLAFFYFTLTSMQSPEFTPPSVIPDQSVQQMMDEIYGPR